MRSLRFPLASLVAALVCVGAQAAEMTPFEAQYSWNWHGAEIAVSTVKLTSAADGTWTYTSTNEARGLGVLAPYRPNLKSTLRITDDGVEPLSFVATGSGDSHNANVTFDWSTNRVTGTYEGTDINMPIMPGIQDDLSVQIAMIAQLRRGQTPDHLSMLDKNKVREYRFQREGEETLTTPMGKIGTVIYSSQHTGSPRITRYWAAPSMGYVPLRVQQTRKGDVEWTMEVRSLKQ